MSAKQHYMFVLANQFSQLAFVCAIEPLRLANRVSGQELYRWSLSSENGTQALCSNQTITLVDYDFLSLPTADQLFLVSGVDVKEAATPELIALLRRQHAHGTQLFAKKVSDGHAPTTCT